MEVDEAVTKTIEPFRLFMMGRVQLDTMSVLAALRPETSGATLETAPLSLLVPSFLLSEIRTAFQIGFLIFLPFLIIDLSVAAIPYVYGYDDGAASHCILAVQTCVFRSGGWMEPYQRRFGQKLLLTI